MKEIVILIKHVMIVFYVDWTIAQNYLDFILSLIAVMPQLLEMKIFVQLPLGVKLVKETVIYMKNAKKISFADQIIVHIHLVLILKQIAVSIIHKQLLVMKAFAQM